MNITEIAPNTFLTSDLGIILRHYFLRFGVGRYQSWISEAWIATIRKITQELSFYDLPLLPSSSCNVDFPIIVQAANKFINTTRDQGYKQEVIDDFMKVTLFSQFCGYACPGGRTVNVSQEIYETWCRPEVVHNYISSFRPTPNNLNECMSEIFHNYFSSHFSNLGIVIQDFMNELPMFLSCTNLNEVQYPGLSNDQISAYIFKRRCDVTFENPAIQDSIRYLVYYNVPNRLGYIFDMAFSGLNRPNHISDFLAKKILRGGPQDMVDAIAPMLNSNISSKNLYCYSSLFPEHFAISSSVVSSREEESSWSESIISVIGAILTPIPDIINSMSEILFGDGSSNIPHEIHKRRYGNYTDSEMYGPLAHDDSSTNSTSEQLTAVLGFVLVCACAAQLGTYYSSIRSRWSGGPLILRMLV